MARQKIVVCDTNVVIEYFKQNFSVMNEMERIGYENLAVSAITIGEMYFGALNKQELSKIKIKIEKFIPLEINAHITAIGHNCVFLPHRSTKRIRTYELRKKEQFVLRMFVKNSYFDEIIMFKLCPCLVYNRYFHPTDARLRTGL